ncbi:hypothetical protein L1987_81652 [Smallanthus sonchifolius]|uniref:Uncharacterized protein n=2 Tax=Smallanthus sonchifolius TaxID=185202 RepID=A0ACB8YQB8_9ASTR|nr:hypothetical protein L1987_81642 [Smallanthus sonchifolius]KAI3687947.1 hypothetical protein L1987_81652 [Smallanthus sonchifolius]
MIERDRLELCVLQPTDVQTVEQPNRAICITVKLMISTPKTGVRFDKKITEGNDLIHGKEAMRRITSNSCMFSKAVADLQLLCCNRKSERLWILKPYI